MPEEVAVFAHHALVMTVLFLASEHPINEFIAIVFASAAQLLSIDTQLKFARATRVVPLLIPLDVEHTAIRVKDSTLNDTNAALVGQPFSMDLDFAVSNAFASNENHWSEI